MGTILRVNLTTGEIKREALDPELAHMYIGARGLGTKILYDELDIHCDPLSPENILIFINGPLSMTLGLSSGRNTVVTKSPLTGTICSSNAGGYFPGAFKTAGYDAIIFTGKAASPVYLSINDDKVQLKDATPYWGLSCVETDHALKQTVNPRQRSETKTSCIGPAGENLVRFAGIANDGHRLAARSGVGAVMGSKNLKAIVMRGTQGIKIAEPEEILRSNVIADHIKTMDLGLVFEEFGTPLFVDVLGAVNAMPTQNFRAGFFEDGDLISGAAMYDRTIIRKKGCVACALNCARNTRLPADSKYQGHGDGPEYESLYSFGSNLLINDIDAVTKMNYICNEMGMDTIDAGVTLSALMELYEMGLITEKEIGFPLEWRDADASIRLLEMIAHGDGFGQEAGRGGRYLAEKYGAPQVFMGSKGQGFSAYHPRAMVGQGLLFATSPEGGNHTTGNTIQREINGIPEPMDPLTPEGKPALVKKNQDETAFIESLGLCVFPYMFLENGLEVFTDF
ncbi:MAG: aldehyde ferredoxin oxidoreductase family protein, partial [Chloroflexi bacterium]|nr:aldehyde ferredoxin oxidoreductase family protein [Chloroflexota bacterium]